MSNKSNNSNKPKKYLIYKVTNLVNGKIYIGQTCYDDPNYLGSGVAVKKAIKKYGKENFVKEYIDEASSQEELDAKEKKEIKELNSQDRKIGYNITEGGQNGFTIRAKLSESIKKSMTPEIRAKISESLRNTKLKHSVTVLTQEQITFISLSEAARYFSTNIKALRKNKIPKNLLKVLKNYENQSHE